MINDWLATNWGSIGLSLLSLLAAFAAILLLTRAVGLRSFAKMSASDFVLTVALGSLLASAATTPDPALVQAFAVIAGVFLIQWVMAFLRKRSPAFAETIDNTPLLLMDGPQILEENLQYANVTREDLVAKLREANVLHFGQVCAVVFETTGDISVLHTEGDERLGPQILESVRRRP